MENLRGNKIQEAWETQKNEIIKVQSRTIPLRKKNKSFQMKSACLHKEFTDKLRDKKHKYKKRGINVLSRIPANSLNLLR